MSDLELRALREKYEVMRTLREQHARDVAAGIDPIAPRAQLRELSRRWPGALAEIDRIPPEVLHQRIAVLDETIASGSEPPLWARAWILTHSRLRGALAIKFELRGGRTLDPDHVFPDEAAPYLDRIAEIERPPNGRIVELVYADVAKLLAIDPSTMRDLLMPRTSC